MKVFLTYSYRGDKTNAIDYEFIENQINSFEDVHLVTPKTSDYTKQAAERWEKRKQKAPEEFDPYPYTTPEIGQVHDEAMRRMILSADFFIVEATVKSIRVGMEIEFAIAHKIPTLVLAQTKNYADFIPNPYLFGARYTKYTLKEHLDTFFKKAQKELLSKRFNMYLSDAQFEDLEVLSKQENMNVSEYIRELINSKRKKL